MDERVLNEAEQLMEEMGFGHLRNVMRQLRFETLEDLTADAGETLRALDGHVSSEAWASMLVRAQETLAARANGALEFEEVIEVELDSSSSSSEEEDVAPIGEVAPAGPRITALWMAGSSGAKAPPFQSQETNAEWEPQEHASVPSVPPVKKRQTRCSVCRQSGHNKASCRAGITDPGKGKRKRCQACGELGHVAEECESEVKAGEGMSACSHENHTDWFPDVPLIQPVAVFDGEGYCTKCTMMKTAQEGDQRVKKRKRQKKVHCFACGERGDHMTKHCRSNRAIQGIKHCSNFEHLEWFPEIPVAQPDDAFYSNGNHYCKKCNGRVQKNRLKKDPNKPKKRRIHCQRCGEPGHRKETCKSEDPIPDGMRPCGCALHTEWFPGVPRIQPTSQFYNATVSSCRRCSSHRSALSNAKSRPPLKSPKKKRRKKAVRCRACGNLGHQTKKCNSETKIPDGMRVCTAGRHEEWFPDLPMIQPASSFYKSMNYCKSCHCHYGKKQHLSAAVPVEDEELPNEEVPKEELPEASPGFDDEDIILF